MTLTRTRNSMFALAAALALMAASPQPAQAGTVIVDEPSAVATQPINVVKFQPTMVITPYCDSVVVEYVNQEPTHLIDQLEGLGIVVHAYKVNSFDQMDLEFISTTSPPTDSLATLDNFVTNLGSTHRMLGARAGPRIDNTGTAAYTVDNSLIANHMEARQRHMVQHRQNAFGDFSAMKDARHPSDNHGRLDRLLHATFVSNDARDVDRLVFLF